MNPLHLGGFGVEIQASNPKPHVELMITNGRQNGSLPERYLFLPRHMEYDSIVLENGTGHISLAALRWLSHHNIPVFFLDFDGSVISSILPPEPVKADLRIAQLKAANDPEKKYTIAKAFAEAKIQRSLAVLDWLRKRYDIEREVQATKRAASFLSKANTIGRLRTVEGRTAVRYWRAFAKVLPESLRFQGRASGSHNNNASDFVNSSLNYAYGFLKIICRSKINSCGLESGIGYLHEFSPVETKEPLLYDMQELFRFLCDLSVIEAFESGKLSPKDFYWEKDVYVLRISWEGRMVLLDSLKERFNNRILYKGRMCTWDFVIEQKCLELSRFLTRRTSALDFCEPS